MFIRVGNENDIERCIDLSENFYQTTAYIKHIPLDRNSCRAYFELSISDDMLIVAEKDGVVQGFALVVKAPFPMNANYFVGAELAWWIEPEHRNGTAGLRLLKRAEEQAKKAGVKFLTMVSMQASMPEKIHKLYTSSGYRHEESTYLKVI